MTLRNDDMCIDLDKSDDMVSQRPSSRAFRRCSQGRILCVPICTSGWRVDSMWTTGYESNPRTKNHYKSL